MTMSESDIIKKVKPTLDYSNRPNPNALERWALRPLGWPTTIAIGFLLSFPFFWMATRIGFYWGRPVFSIISFLMLSIGLILMMLFRASERSYAEEEYAPTKSDKPKYMVIWIMFVTGALGHASTLSTVLVFHLYAGEFDRITKTVGATVPAGGSVAFVPGHIGPFQIATISRSKDGQSIGFGDRGDGGFVWSASGELDEPMFYPPDYHGRINDHWFWVAPD